MEKVVYSEMNNISYIVLDDGKYNILDQESWMKLNDALEKANKSKNIIVVLKSSAKAFSAGVNINEMYSLKNYDDAKKFFNLLKEFSLKIIKSEKIFVSAIDGFAYGAACEIAMISDIVIAGKNAKFSLPMARLGIFPPIPFSAGIYTIGLKNVMRMCITCDEIDVYEAKQMGLVDYIVDDLEKAIVEISNRILLSSPNILKKMKKFAEEYRLKLFNETFEELILSSISQDGKKGMEAYLNKKIPQW